MNKFPALPPPLSESKIDRKKLNEYANQYKNFLIYDSDNITHCLNFIILFNRGEFQSKQEIDEYFKPRNSRDKKNN
jgi:hypothetical protein